MKSIRIIAVLAAFAAAIGALVGTAAPAHATVRVSFLPSGGVLRAGDAVVSTHVGPADGGYHYSLLYGSTGNLVEYKVDDRTSTRTVVWQTRTAGTPGRVAMQTNGNLVIYNSAGTAIWTSGTNGYNGARLAVQTDGNLVIRNTAGTAEWARNGLCGIMAINLGRVSSAISAACREVRANTWYSWGGGHGSAPGATYGSVDPSDPVRSANDPYRKGFDCSGLTRWAYYKGWFKDMPVKGGTAAQQWSNGLGGKRLGKTGFAAGDLVYFGTSSNVHHTAIYIGAGQIVEAPQSNEHLKVSALSSHGDLLGGLRVF